MPASAILTPDAHPTGGEVADLGVGGPVGDERLDARSVPAPPGVARSRPRSPPPTRSAGRRWQNAGRPPGRARAVGPGWRPRPRPMAAQLARGADRVLDQLPGARELVLGDRTSLAGLAHAADHLVPLERLDHAAALDHDQLHPSTVVNRRSHTGRCRRRRMTPPLLGDPGVQQPWRRCADRTGSALTSVLRSRPSARCSCAAFGRFPPDHLVPAGAFPTPDCR